MKFKLDENLGLAIARVLREAGHDALTVHDQIKKRRRAPCVSIAEA